MELYLDLRSQPCRSVFMFARVNAIPFEFKLVDLAKGEQYSEEFSKISPVRKVPVMKDGDFVLTESVAILQYLAEKHASRLPDHWYPADLRQRARVNEYLSWQQMNLRAHGSKVFLLKNMYPVVMGQEVPGDKMSSAVGELTQSVDTLEKHFLGERLFLCGPSISLADLVAVAEIMQPVSSGVDVFSGRPKLSAWRDRVKEVVGAALFDEANAAIMIPGGTAQALREVALPDSLKDRYKKLFM
ncbi:glutathione S-transferase theta-1a [Corythoichthys intestinalis]|uniref:glutathione S-transferase theta-1a n=1 Tax=Corythoichthys intestinalis TaxID=161448 RepID=UPI0025A4DC18|nr:glutathione S-transferase theta-1a [Corythoichthys intestinalis]XP_061804510.1 glutathione S-transferase theta-3-like [Nerophis lumbriciformis]